MMATNTRSRIIGVDPGTNILGYAILDVEQEQLKMIAMGTLQLQKFDNHQIKLKEIFLQLQDIIESFVPQQMAIESPFHGKNVQSMLKLGRAQGVAMAAAMTMGLSIHEYSPKKIKQSVTGNGNASKEQVAAMLPHLIKEPFYDRHLDAYDALATAICHHMQSRFGSIAQQSKGSGWKAFLKANPDRISR